MKLKSIREMTPLERKHHSLSAKVFRATLLNCVVLGLVALVIGLFFYSVTSADQNISMASNVAQSAYNPVVHGLGGREICSQVMEIYSSLTPEERADPAAPEYLARYDAVRDNENYATIINLLYGLAEANYVYDVYIAIYDRETEAIVYVADPDRNVDTMCPTGFWESADERELERFLNWDKTENPYYFGYSQRYGWLCTVGVPIERDGRLYGFLLADATLSEMILSMRKVIISFTLAMLLITAVISCFSTWRSRKSLVQPVNAIAEAAQQYMADKVSGAEETEHFSRLNIRPGDEIENLSLIMADMERDLADYESSLTAVTAEKERIATELNMAANIQAHMLPNTFPPFPDRKEFEISATMTPAKEVGGDFYDFFMVDEDHLALVMADVSGKGVPAALFMMTSRTMIKDAALSGLDPAAVLERVNIQLCENNPDYMFVTVWIGLLELSTGRLTWADAGHEKLFLYQEGAWKCLPKKGGPALAAIEPELMEPGQVLFRNHELTLYPGDAICQYTDGVTEAVRSEREQFGKDRLQEALVSAGAVSPTELLPHIRSRIDDFVQGAPQFDDITMLALQYHGKE